MPRGPRAGERAFAAVMLGVGLPVVCVLSWAGAATESGGGAAPTTATVGIVAEQVATARNVTPFGVSRDGESRTVWAFGQTRGASVEESGPAPAPEPSIVDAPDPGRDPEPPDPGDDAIDEDDGEREGAGAGERAGALGRDDEGARGRRAGAPTAPATSVLLAGTVQQPGTPTSWRRAAPPQDADGKPLPPGGWRPAGGDAPLHAGEATPQGAAAILAQLGAPGSTVPRPAILARAATDGRFRALPEPSAVLLAPATETFDPLARTARLPFAVVDLPVRTTDPAPTPTGQPTPTPTPTPTPQPVDPLTPGPTSPDRRLDPVTSASPLAPPGAATGVLLAPPGGDGVLSWTGAAWVEEPYLARDGSRPEGGRSPVALAATPDGDGVALLQNSDPGSEDRFRLYRRTADRTAWREITLPATASLLTGPLPREITAVRATPAPGDPLTVTDGHWWVDLIATRDDGVEVSATVHLTPGDPGRPGTTPDPSTPTTPDPTAAPSPSPSPTASPSPSPTPSPTPSPAPSPTTTPTPDDTTPDPTTPTTPDPTTPPPLASTATVDAPWCQPTLAGCERALRAEFPTARGYRSQAFAGAGLGGRTITSPVIPEATGAAAIRDASASGGYLDLGADADFHLRSGIGDRADGLGGTEAAAFDGPGLGWVGAARAVGHVMPGAASAGARLRDQNATEAGFGRLIDQADALIDIALAPADADGTIEAIALGSTNNLRVKRPDRPWVSFGLGGLFEDDDLDERAFARAIAWPSTDRVVAVGSRGMLLEGRVTAFGPDRVTQVGGVASAAAGLDLLDVGFSAAGPGWAIGRSGAMVRFDGQSWSRRTLPVGDPAATADLRQLAFTGDEGWVASSVGLLRLRPAGEPLRPETLPADAGLAALMAEDGRGPGIRTVATLPDGTVVVDARYVTVATPGVAPTWQRLAFPAEGDTIAVALRRTGEAGTPDAGLQIVASIADEVPPRRGRAPGLDDPELSEDVFEGDSDELAQIELAPEIRDGRVSILGTDGWVDVTRAPIEPSAGIDLPYLASPVGALALRDGATSWAIGGRGTAGRFDAPLAQSPFAAAIPFAETLAPGQTEDPSGDGAATTPAAPGAAPGAAPPAGGAPAGRVRILIGGHPSCQDECAGREDQRTGPTETLRQALRTAARTAGGGADTPAVGAVVIGGGRSARPLSALGAESYGALLDSVPGSAPVFPAIGSSDAQTPASRERFGRHVGERFAPRISAAAGSTRGAQRPGGDASGAGTQAYVFEAGAGDRPVRVLVIDNAGGALRDGPDGPQARWIQQTLADGRARGLVSIVIGSVALDSGSTVDPGERSSQLDLLLAGGAAAYVSTDGGDDPRDLRTFGPRMRRQLLTSLGGSIQLLHSSALGHFMTNQSLVRYLLSDGLSDGDQPVTDGPVSTTPTTPGTTPTTPGATTPTTPGTTPTTPGATTPPAGPQRDDYLGALTDYTLQPQLLAIDVDTTVPADTAAVAAVNVPVIRDFAPADRRQVTRTFAQVVSVATETDADNGLRLVDERRPEAGLQDHVGPGIGAATSEQCGLFGPSESCAAAPPTDMRFEVEDPSIAVFVRARVVRRRSSDPDYVPGGTPQIVLDAAGNPVVDPRSPVLCPIRAGTTSYAVTAGGRSLRVPLVVRDPEDGIEQNNLTDPRSPCGFTYDDASAPGRAVVREDPEDPPAPVEPPAVPNPFQPPVPAPPAEARPPAPAPPAQPAPALIAAPPLLPYLEPLAEPAGPPPVPNLKPVTPPAPPAPPSGVGVQQVSAPQVQSVTAQGIQNLVVAVRSEERQREVARESSDHSATVYSPQTRPDLFTALTAGALAILMAGGGFLAGRRRRLTQAARSARAWLR